MKLQDIKDGIKSNLWEKTNAYKKHWQLDSKLTAAIIEVHTSTNSQGRSSILLVPR